MVSSGTLPDAVRLLNCLRAATCPPRGTAAANNNAAYTAVPGGSDTSGRLPEVVYQMIYLHFVSHSLNVHV